MNSISSVFNNEPVSASETQTSKTDISNKNNLCDKILSKSLPPQVFEYIEVKKDPNDPNLVTVIKETFTEEIIDSSTSSEQSLSNRYQYCKEIISPMKSNSNFRDCHDGYKDSIEDLPPCKNVQTNKKPTNDTNNNSDSCKAPLKSCDSCETKVCVIISQNDIEEYDKNESAETDQKASDAKKSSLVSSEKSSTACSKKPSNSECNTCKKSNEIDEDALRTCIIKCLQKGQKCKKSKLPMEKAIGIKEPKSPDEKPAFFVYEKPKEFPPPDDCTEKSSVQSFLESSSSTFGTFKTSVQGFIGMVYEKTRDAVHTISSGGCKHLGFDTKTDSSSKSNSESDTNMRYPKDCQYTRQFDEIYDLENKNFDNGKPSINTIENRAKPRASTVERSRKDNIFEEIVASRMNRSSPYDTPLNSQDSTEFNLPFVNSFFSGIKTKIFSFFHDFDNETGSDVDE